MSAESAPRRTVAACSVVGRESCDRAAAVWMIQLSLLRFCLALKISSGSYKGTRRRTSALVSLLCSVLWTPSTAHASGSYGAVVEKGLRGCISDNGTGIVVCFEAPSVNPESRALFLQAWPAASPFFVRGATTTETLRVRSVVMTARTPPAGESEVTYVARVDRVMPLLACSDDLRFHSSDGSVRLQGVVSDCTPR